MKKNNYILYFSFAVAILVTFLNRDVPFFWDGTFFSEITDGFYNGAYSPFDCPHNLDNVTFPLYSTYLFLAWKLFSKSLLVSHLAILPFLLGICYEFFRLSKKFLNGRFVLFAMILLLLEPTFMTQGIIMGYDIILLYLFLLALNLLLSNKKLFYSLIISLIALYSIRGLFLALSLSVIQFMLLYPEYKFRSFLIVLKQNVICVLPVIAWFAYHKVQTGWFIISPIHENTDERIQSFPMMLKHIIFIAWKLADFGRIFLWIALVVGLIIVLKKKIIAPEFRTLLLFIFIPVIVTALFMIPFSNPAGHRYFMFTFLCLIIGVCYLLQQIAGIKMQIFAFAFFCIALISGNFWLYPERFGNGWDASLKVLPYFELREQMDRYIVDNKIEPAQVGTQYPLIADRRFSHLEKDHFTYTNVWRGPLNNYSYFLQSNVINTDIPEQVEEVKKSWILLKELKAGMVYLRLYKNPG